MLNVLSISLDSSLAEPEIGQAGDTLTRQMIYANHINKLFIVVKTQQIAGLRRNYQVDNLEVYHTLSANRFTYIDDAYGLGCRIIAENTIDVLTTQDAFVTGLVGYLLKRRFSIPLNIQLHSSEFSDNEYWLREKFSHRLLYVLGTLLLRRSDTIRTVSTDENKALVDKLGIPASKVYVLPVRVDLDAFKNGQVDAGLKLRYLSRGYKIILAVGALIYPKDFDMLIRAVPHVLVKQPRTIFIIVGKGPQKKYLESLAKSLGVSRNVLLVGEIPHERIPDYFASCDVFALSSVYEGLGRVRIEAAAAGKPVVTTNVSGTHESVIDGQTGFIVEKKDYRSLAERIIRLLDDPEFAARLGRQGQKLVLRRYQKEENVKQLIRMWTETAKCRECSNRS